MANFLCVCADIKYEIYLWSHAGPWVPFNSDEMPVGASLKLSSNSAWLIWSSVCWKADATFLRFPWRVAWDSLRQTKGGYHECTREKAIHCIADSKVTLKPAVLSSEIATSCNHTMQKTVINLPNFEIIASNTSSHLNVFKCEEAREVIIRFCWSTWRLQDEDYAVIMTQNFEAGRPGFLYQVQHRLQGYHSRHCCQSYLYRIVIIEGKPLSQ